MIFYVLIKHNVGRVAQDELDKSKLSNNILGKIWRLADHDQDGHLNNEEFSLARHLIKVKYEGSQIPEELLSQLIPLSQREED